MTHGPIHLKKLAEVYQLFKTVWPIRCTKWKRRKYSFSPV